jgi:hypothetical protein
LCRAIELKAVPHWTTVQKAAGRLLCSARVRRLIDETVALARDDGRGRGQGRVSHAAADSTGFDTHHVSRYFIWRTHRNRKGKQPARRVSYRRFGKLMVLVCCTTHLILNAEASAGPTPDIDQLASLMAHTPRGLTIERLVADAGFDSAANHQLLREEHGIMSVILYCSQFLGIVI